MHHALVRRLVQPLDGQLELGLHLVRRAFADEIAQVLDLHFDGFDGGAVAFPPLLGLP